MPSLRQSERLAMEKLACSSLKKKKKHKEGDFIKCTCLNSKTSVSRLKLWEDIDFSRFEKTRDLGFDWYGAYLLSFEEFEYALETRKPLIVLRKDGKHAGIRAGEKKYSKLLSFSPEKRRAFFYSHYTAMDLSIDFYKELHKKDEYGMDQDFQEFSRKTLRCYSSVERLKTRLKARGAL